jgi:hypothetical protein
MWLVCYRGALSADGKCEFHRGIDQEDIITLGTESFPTKGVCLVNDEERRMAAKTLRELADVVDPDTDSSKLEKK